MSHVCRLRDWMGCSRPCRGLRTSTVRLGKLPSVPRLTVFRPSQRSKTCKSSGADVSFQSLDLKCLKIRRSVVPRGVYYLQGKSVIRSRNDYTGSMWIQGRPYVESQITQFHAQPNSMLLYPTFLSIVPMRTDLIVPRSQ